MRALVLVFLSSGCLDQLVPFRGQSHTSAPADLAEPVVGVEEDLAQAETADLGEPSGDDLQPSMDQSQASADLAPFSLVLEAESGVLTAPMAATADANASGGQYIAVPAGGTLGKAVYTFTVPATGNYALWGRVLAPTDANNSFHVSIDADTIDNDPADAVSTIWDLPVAAAYAVVRVNMRIDAAGTTQDQIFTLTAGPHTLYLNQREELTQIDRIALTSSLSVAPSL